MFALTNPSTPRDLSWLCDDTYIFKTHVQYQRKNRDLQSFKTLLKKCLSTKAALKKWKEHQLSIKILPHFGSRISIMGIGALQMNPDQVIHRLLMTIFLTERNRTHV